MTGPQASLLADGRRLHLNHGPIDLIIEAFGAPAEIVAAYRQATARFQTILQELVTELKLLRSPVTRHGPQVHGSTARRMAEAVRPHAGVFITPMAAVAGSVADEILATLLKGRNLDRAYVNNGGDSALYLRAGQSLKLAIAGTGNGSTGSIAIASADPARGVATSGWRGRSFSLGIADAVTVLARSAAQADAAATIIANAVDLPGHRAVHRTPARLLQPDSDLGDLAVTTAVGALSATETAQALAAGFDVAKHLVEQRLIEGAALFLNCESRFCGAVSQPPKPPLLHPAKEPANA